MGRDDGCLFCGADTWGRRGWNTPVLEYPMPTLAAVLGGARLPRCVAVRTCRPCIEHARQLRVHGSLVEMYSPRRQDDA